MTKCEFALKRFEEGFRGGQSVLEAYANDFGLDPKLALKIATPLAGGSSLEGYCCVVSGALLVLGLKYGLSNPGDMDEYASIFEKINKFARKFKSKHGDLHCHKLIGFDLFSEEGYKEFQKKDLHHSHCVYYVEDTVNILEEIMNGA
jgi:C_GCAxxG_C_C family probable redox protein